LNIEREGMDALTIMSPFYGLVRVHKKLAWDNHQQVPKNYMDDNPK